MASCSVAAARFASAAPRGLFVVVHRCENGAARADRAGFWLRLHLRERGR